MIKQLLIFIKNIFKLIGIMYISISLKNLLQISIGTLTNYSEVTKPYRLINLTKRSNFEARLNHLKLIFLYDYLLFALIAYLWLFIILYLLVAKYGNRLGIHICYIILVYLIVVTYFDPFKYNILFMLISLMLGFSNWWLFKKWIRFN